MFCLYCQYYKSLDEHCRKDKNIHNIQEVMECQDYQYKGDVECL